MKKLLVGTLALSAVSVSAPVSAQMMDGVTVSLDNLFAYKSWSDENTDSGGANNTLITNESHVVFTAEKTTDSGLTVGIYNRLDQTQAETIKKMVTACICLVIGAKFRPVLSGQAIPIRSVQMGWSLKKATPSQAARWLAVIIPLRWVIPPSAITPPMSAALSWASLMGMRVQAQRQM